MTFVANRSFARQIERQLGRDPRLHRTLRNAGDAIRDEAERISPDETGNYDRKLQVVQDGQEVAVGSTDIAAHLIEWGSANNPPHGVMRRAVAAVGLELSAI